MSKAKRYDAHAAKRKNSTLKGILLYLLPAPILITAFLAFLAGDVHTIITTSISFALFFLSATVAKRGFIFEKIYHDSAIAKAPSRPYKGAAAFLLAFSTLFTSHFCTPNSLILSLLLALAAFVGFFLYYGFDPREDKVGDLRLGARAEEVIEITQNAKERVDKLKSLKRELKDFESQAYLQDIIMQTEEIITSIEHNPNDLSRARKFFKVYLHRTEEISHEFVNNLHNGNIDAKMTANYNTLLKSVLETIKEQKEKLDDDDILKLDVQIEALTKQLNHEGI